MLNGNRSMLNSYISIFVFQASHATVAQVACDSLLLLCDKADVLLELYPNVPSKIIQVQNNIYTGIPYFKVRFETWMDNESFVVQCLGLVGHSRSNDITRKAWTLDGVDAVLLGRVGHALRTDCITASVPGKASFDDVIYS